MTVDAVIFDWGGTLTPWHDIDLVVQWAAYARVYDPADDGLAERLAAAEVSLWREQQASGGANGTGTLDHVFASCGVDTSQARHGTALASYLEAWDPHTFADPDARPLLEGLRQISAHTSDGRIALTFEVAYGHAFRPPARARAERPGGAILDPAGVRALAPPRSAGTAWRRTHRRSGHNAPSRRRSSTGRARP